MKNMLLTTTVLTMMSISAFATKGGSGDVGTATAWNASQCAAVKVHALNSAEAILNQDEQNQANRADAADLVVASMEQINFHGIAKNTAGNNQKGCIDANETLSAYVEELSGIMEYINANGGVEAFRK